MKLILGFVNRANDLKNGALIGEDKYGNKYYEDKKNNFFGESLFFSQAEICHTFLDYLHFGVTLIY